MRVDDNGNVFPTEGDVDFADGMGNDLLSSDTTDGPASRAYLRSEWLRGVANGDFADGPMDPSMPINSDTTSLNYNPLPGWKIFQNDLPELVQLWWAANANTGSGYRLEIRVPAIAAGAADKKVILYQDVPVRSTPSRNVSLVGMVTAVASPLPAAGNTVFTYKITEWDAALTERATLVDISDDANNYSAAHDLNTEPPALGSSLHGYTNFVRVYIGIWFLNDAQPACNYNIYEVMATPSQPMISMADLTTPTNAPAVMVVHSGALDIENLTKVNFNLATVEVGTVIMDSGWQLWGWDGPTTTISADKNNYNIWTDTGWTDWTSLLGLIMKVGGADRTITGLLAPSPVAEGACVWIAVDPAAAFNLIFANESASSTAANRLKLPNNSNLTLHPGEAALFRWSAPLNRWHVIATSQAPGTGGGGSLTDHTHAVSGSGGTGGGNTLNPVTLNASGAVRLSGVLAATISADQNNYAPGISGKCTLVMTASGATRTITGFDATGFVEGQLLFIFNDATNPLVLAHNNTSSLAGNRIGCLGAANFTMPINSGAIFQYLPTEFGNVPFRMLTAYSAGGGSTPSTAGPDADIAIDTAGAAGSGTSTYAESQHGHKLTTSAASPQPTDATAANAGTSGTAPSRGDHRHLGHNQAHDHSTAGDGTSLNPAAQFAFTGGGSQQTITTTGAITAQAVTNTVIRWNGASAATFHGFAGGVEGRVIVLVNATAGQTAVVANQSATEGTTSNRIIMPDGANENLFPGEALIFVYDGGTTRWRCIGAMSSYGSAPAAIGTAAAGTAGTKPARGDHVHPTGAGTPTTAAYNDTAAVGSGPAAAMSDHRHGMPASGGTSFATPAIALGSAAAAGAAGTAIRSDSTIAAFDTTAPVTQAFGDTAAVGVAAFAARRDHKHGMPASGGGSLTDHTHATTGSGATGGGATVNPTGLDDSGYLRLSGNISVTLSADQNDWAPSGIATAAAVYLNVSGSMRTITGISATGFSEGQILILHVAAGFGGNALTLAHASASSASGNRFICPESSNLVVKGNTTIVLRYTPLIFAASPFQVVAAYNGPRVPIVTVTGTGTWTPDPKSTAVLVMAWGAGGGGSSGACGGTGAVRPGGNGGGGGSFVQQMFPISLISTPVTLTAGTGGTGGTAAGTTASDGVVGGNGGNSTFGSYLTAYGGGGGKAAANTIVAESGGSGGGTLGAGLVGSTAATLGGAPANTAGANGWAGQGGGGSITTAGGSSDTGGGAGGGHTVAAGGGFAGACSVWGGGGGGSGGSSGSSQTGGFAGGKSGTNLWGATGGGGSSGGVGGTAGGAGASGAGIAGGSGGGGGGGATGAGVNGGNGGNGGLYGGGGGGGGAAVSGGTAKSGAGGNGGNGAFVIIEW